MVGQKKKVIDKICRIYYNKEESMVNDTISYNEKTFRFTGTFFGYDLMIFKHGNERLLVDKKTGEVDRHYILEERG